MCLVANFRLQHKDQIVKTELTQMILCTRICVNCRAFPRFPHLPVLTALLCTWVNICVLCVCGIFHKFFFLVQNYEGFRKWNNFSEPYTADIEHVIPRCVGSRSFDNRVDRVECTAPLLVFLWRCCVRVGLTRSVSFRSYPDSRLILLN